MQLVHQFLHSYVKNTAKFLSIDKSFKEFLIWVKVSKLQLLIQALSCAKFLQSLNKSISYGDLTCFKFKRLKC